MPYLPVAEVNQVPERQEAPAVFVDAHEVQAAHRLGIDDLHTGPALRQPGVEIEVGRRVVPEEDHASHLRGVDRLQQLALARRRSVEVEAHQPIAIGCGSQVRARRYLARVPMGKILRDEHEGLLAPAAQEGNEPAALRLNLPRRCEHGCDHSSKLIRSATE